MKSSIIKNVAATTFFTMLSLIAVNFAGTASAKSSYESLRGLMSFAYVQNNPTIYPNYKAISNSIDNQFDTRFPGFRNKERKYNEQDLMKFIEEWCGGFKKVSKDKFTKLIREHQGTFDQIDELKKQKA